MLDRGTAKFRTTLQLAELVERLSPRAGRKAHPATRVFQALRIAVNDEIGQLERGLRAALSVLRTGGRCPTGQDKYDRRAYDRTEMPAHRTLLTTGDCTGQFNFNSRQ